MAKGSQKSGAVVTTTQTPIGIGHNGAPASEAERLYRLLGPAKTQKVLPPFECGAPWTGKATEKELKRLAKLQRRISIRELSLSELKKERKLIMNRCIRRMRRAEGKN